MNICLLTFDIKTDNGGHLVPLEALQQIPFSIQRVFFSYQIHPGTRRACHAHKDFQEVLICLQGSCRLHLDDGFTSQELVLDRPDRGLCIGPGVWEEVFECSPDCILLGLADMPYDRESFIWDYETFQRTRVDRP